MCPSVATCLPADCCFSEIALYNSNSACWFSTKRNSFSSHRKLTCSRHDIAEKYWIGVKQQSLNHSLKQSQIYYVASKIIQVFFINFFCSGFEDWREYKSFKISNSKIMISTKKVPNSKSGCHKTKKVPNSKSGWHKTKKVPNSKSGCHISTKKRQCMNQKIMRSRPRPQPPIELCN